MTPESIAQGLGSFAADCEITVSQNVGIVHHGPSDAIATILEMPYGDLTVMVLLSGSDGAVMEEIDHLGHLVDLMQGAW